MSNTAEEISRNELVEKSLLEALTSDEIALEEWYAKKMLKEHATQHLTAVKEKLEDLKCNVDKDWHDGALEDAIKTIEEELQ